MASRKLVVAGVAAGVLAIGATPTYAALGPTLSSDGPTEVAGTDASGKFDIADRTVLQVRYADQGTLTYTFELVNDGLLPIKVTGLAPVKVKPTLFDYKSLKSDGSTKFTVGAGKHKTVTLSLLMTSCERLSSRAGSFVNDVHVRTSSLGIDRTVVVTLPEQIHSGSPREASCPLATARLPPPRLSTHAG